MVRIEVLMPVITEHGDDGVVTAWFVDEGSHVAPDQLIAEVQAEKVAQDVRAPEAGIVRDRAGINDPVPQGAPICVILDETEDAVRPPQAPQAAAAPSASPSGDRIMASPSARRAARELGVDLAGVTGTGPNGRITEADVRAAAGPALPAVGMTALRATIARNMRRSVAETAPVTLMTTVEVTPQSERPMTAWIVRATALALRDHPALNGSHDGDRFTSAAAANVAVAVQTSEGLVAPVVRDPAGSSIEEVAAEIARLAEEARARKLTATDYEGATFTVSNLGAYGIDAFTPIINLPQVAILGVGALRVVPGFDQSGAVVARHVMTLSLTFDHSFVDGAPAAEFLATIVDLLETDA